MEKLKIIGFINLSKNIHLRNRKVKKRKRVKKLPTSYRQKSFPSWESPLNTEKPSRSLFWHITFCTSHSPLHRPSVDRQGHLVSPATSSCAEEDHRMYPCTFPVLLLRWQHQRIKWMNRLGLRNDQSCTYLSSLVWTIAFLVMAAFCLLRIWSAGDSEFRISKAREALITYLFLTTRLKVLMLLPPVFFAGMPMSMSILSAVHFAVRRGNDG